MKSIQKALLAIAMLFVLTFGAVISQAQVNNELIRVYKQALELNKGRFADPNLIFVGDTVLFPAHEGSGVVAYIADKPTEGRHDSFWRLSEKYVAGQLITVPADTIKVVTPVPSAKKAEEATNKFWLTWLLSILALTLLICFFVALFWNNLFKRAVNPDNHQPVGGNIDIMPREQSLTSVMRRYLLPGERLVSFRRGTLTNSLGKRRFAASMEFGDNVRRDAWLNSGDRVSTAIIEDANGNRRTQHLRSACSNGFGSGTFELPNGWSINYDETEEAGRVVTESDGQDGQRLVVTPTPAPIPAPTPTTSLQGNMGNLVQVVQALSIEGSKVNISFKETKDKVNLKIEIGKKKTKKKADNEL